MASTNVQFSVATHMMTALGFHYGEEVTSALLAESVNADASFVRKLVSKLAKAGLLKTTRGKGGTCALARPPEKITLLDIYRAAQVPQAFSIHDYPVEHACIISCKFKGLMADVLQNAQSELEKSLARRKLSDLVACVD